MMAQAPTGMPFINPGNNPVPQGQQKILSLTYYSNVVLAREQLPSTAVVLFTVPPQVTFVMTSFSVLNTDTGGAHTVTVRLIAPGGANTSASDYWKVSLPASPAGFSPGSGVEEVLTPGYQIVAFADAANVVNIKINGVNLVQQ